MLRRLRYTFNFNDNKMISLFALAGAEVTREQVSNWLKKEDDTAYVNFTDSQLATFLNGFIVEKRGKKEGEAPAIEKRMTNNLVLTKLKIALNLKAEDIVDLLALSDLRISKTELSAFFRKPDHKNYRQCKDQFLRNFLKGIELKYFVKRPDKFIKNKANSETQKTDNKEQQAAQATQKTSYKSATPKASKIYVNPKKRERENTEPKRKVLKLKPEDIWKE